MATTIEITRETEAGYQPVIVPMPSAERGDALYPRQDDGGRWMVWDSEWDEWINPAQHTGDSAYAWTPEAAAIVAIEIMEDRYGVEYA